MRRLPPAGRSDRRRAASEFPAIQNWQGTGKLPVTPCGLLCGDLCPCLEKVDNRPPGPLFALFGAIWRNQPPNPADGECRAAKMGEKPGMDGRVEKCAG